MNKNTAAGIISLVTLIALIAFWGDLEFLWLSPEAKLNTLIDESDYFIILSRRVYKNSLDHPDKFPRTAEFYRSLFDGFLGYKLIYQSRLTSDSLLLTTSEETFEVFDNPKVMIFERKQ